MHACVRRYKDAGVRGVPIRPDHVPTMDGAEGESNETSGYHMLGRLWAVGYVEEITDGRDGMGEMGEMERTGKKMGRGERREMMGETGEFEVTREVLDSPSKGSGRCSCLGPELRKYVLSHMFLAPLPVPSHCVSPVSFPCISSSSYCVT